MSVNKNFPNYQEYKVRNTPMVFKYDVRMNKNVWYVGLSAPGMNREQRRTQDKRNRGAKERTKAYARVDSHRQIRELKLERIRIRHAENHKRALERNNFK